MKIGKFGATEGKALHIEVDEDTFEEIKGCLYWGRSSENDTDEKILDVDHGHIDSFVDTREEEDVDVSDDVWEMFNAILKLDYVPSVIQFFVED